MSNSRRMSEGKKAALNDLNMRGIYLAADEDLTFDRRHRKWFVVKNTSQNNNPFVNIYQAGQVQMTRSQRLQERFPIGSKVIVQKILPDKGEWPGYYSDMNQFFSGVEVEVLGYLPDKFGDSLGLMLNTKALGANKNHIFSAEWVSPSTAPLANFEIISTKRNRVRNPGKTEKITSLKATVELVSKEGQKIQFPAELRLPADMTIQQKESEPLPPKPKPELMTEDKKEDKPVVKKADTSIGFGGALAASFLTAVAVAAAQKVQQKKQIQAAQAKASTEKDEFQMFCEQQEHVEVAD